MYFFFSEYFFVNNCYVFLIVIISNLLFIKTINFYCCHNVTKGHFSCTIKTLLLYDIYTLLNRSSLCLSYFIVTFINVIGFNCCWSYCRYIIICYFLKCLLIVILFFCSLLYFTMYWTKCCSLFLLLLSLILFM